MVSVRAVSAGVVACLTISGACADVSSVNSFRENTRNFNDFPSSTLVAASNYGAGTVSVTESNFGNAPGGSFANRHRIFFSNTGGATNYPLQNSDGFDLSFNINLTAQNMRLAEAGFYSDTFVGGEPRYIVKANDAAFAFDAWLPFVFAGSYGNGVTTNLRMVYAPGSGQGDGQAVASTVTFYRDGTDLGTFNAGNFNSPDFLNGYANNSVFGFYMTFSPNIDANNNADPNAFASAVITDIVLVPSPSAAALLGLAGLGALRRRR
jgi:hypothetical protein